MAKLCLNHDATDGFTQEKQRHEGLTGDVLESLSASLVTSLLQGFTFPPAPVCLGLWLFSVPWNHLGCSEPVFLPAFPVSCLSGLEGWTAHARTQRETQALLSNHTH